MKKLHIAIIALLLPLAGVCKAQDYVTLTGLENTP